MLEKFCFATEANYPNYVNRLKHFSLKRYLELDLEIPFYISTNFPDMFSEYRNNPLIKVFHIDDLRKHNEKSLKYEELPENPQGIYPAKYPWNLRRFILRKACEDGFLGLFGIECDTRIDERLDKNTLHTLMMNLFEPNTVKSSSTRFRYKNRYPSQELFYYHQKYIDDLKLNFEGDQYDTLDGTNQLFFAETSERLIEFLDIWDFICNYGYEQEFGYKTGYLSNLSFVIPMSNFKLVDTPTPFETHHVYGDRY
jgi:hypothetical protein